MIGHPSKSTSRERPRRIECRLEQRVEVFDGEIGGRQGATVELFVIRHDELSKGLIAGRMMWLPCCRLNRTMSV
jgi:hypothetical protein